MKFFKFLNNTKRVFLFVIVFCYNKKTFAQYSLVNNGNFEDYVTCPNVFNYNLKFWYSASNYGVEYFNTCATNQVFSVPSNLNGDNYQFPKSGNGYVGLYFLYAPPNNYRNYYQTKLKDSLQQGKYYYTEFYVVNFNQGQYFSNNISLLLSKSKVAVDTTNFPSGLLYANAQIYNYGNPVINDTLNWIKVSGIYKAEGGEQYLTLGNFKDDAHTQYYVSQSTGLNGAAIMIDDVSVIPLDSFCLKADAGKDTTIAQGDSVFIGSYTNGIDSLKWFNNNTVIDSTRPGFWVKPTTSTFYILQQTVNGCFSADTVWVNVGTVPLKFLSFSLFPSFGGVRGGWTTANEVSVSHFNIQRSVSRSIGSKDFITVGKVVANNKSYNEYSFYDSPPVEGLGVVYYRIESIDFDGRKQYSTTQQITTKPQTQNIVLYPNPAKEQVTIECKGAKELIIVDYLGRQIAHFVRNDGFPQPQIINTKELVKGVYLVKAIMANGGIKTEKLLIE